MQTIITESQRQSLEDKIYSSLMLLEVCGNDGEPVSLGMGETGEARDEAQRIVSEWMEETTVETSISEEQKKIDTVYSTLSAWNTDGKYTNILEYLKPAE